MVFQFGSTKYSFKIHKGFLLLCSFFIIVFLLMSAWQWHRYDYKKTLMNNYETRLKMLPKPFELVRSDEDLQFQPIAVDGEFENDMLMLVQNRFHANKLGFEILTPLRVNGSSQLLLVDRGWVQKPPEGLPKIPEVTATQHLTGYIKIINEYQFILGQNIIDSNKKPLIMQKIDLEEISHTTQKSFYPYVLRLDPDQENGFVRDWVISSMLPERHMMYAIQWLAFSLVVMVGLFYFSLERRVHE